ncbi:MAG: DEAD/DEAH box helicase family protein [Acutalibacteraceae bacterium]
MGIIKINTAKKVVPMIYAYTTPDIPKHDGWIKIGYTEQEVEKRLKQQTHTADIDYKVEWKGSAMFDDGTGETFHDSDFHAYLTKNDIERKAGTEWFYTDSSTSHKMFIDFRVNRGILRTLDDVKQYRLRDEQAEAVKKAKEYFLSHQNGEFLWNCKPRFGKTLSVYDLCKQLNAQNVLIVTNRPAIANSWYEDYAKFMGTESGFHFVSSTESLKGKKYVLSRQEYLDVVMDDELGCIEFVSLQDLKGSIYFGGEYDKLKEVKDINWDLLVIDEAHEGVDTSKTDIAFTKIKRKHTLHLSGTPFKALANDKFEQDAIYNWTYADEQRKKHELADSPDNPYAKLPQLNMFTYQMSEIVCDELSRGKELDGETVEYAFDLNEFFLTKSSDKFVHEESVDKFLDALTKQEKFPFSTEELRNELKHTLWLLNRVDSAKALAKKLQEHPVFGSYKIIVAAGDGRLDENEETKKSYNKVCEAIKNNDKTITLSVGQLTTGVTIPEWTAVLMLSNVKSPALYMQAAFRAQNPHLFQNGSEFLRKKNAYVFDFDPARTLTIFEEFANDLSSETSDGRGSSDQRKQNVRELLNFFPVIGEDENGRMIELDAEKVLSIPRKIKSKEVVRRGFMSNFLFQNISNVFHAPQEVIDIIKNFTPVEEPKNSLNITPETGDDLSLNDKGEVELDDNFIIGTAQDIFGDKIYEIQDDLQEVIDNTTIQEEKKPKDDTLAKLKAQLNPITNRLLETAKNNYGSALTKGTQNRLETKIKADADKALTQAYGSYSIDTKTLEQEHENQIKTATEEEKAELNRQFEEQKKQLEDDFRQSLTDTINTIVEDSGRHIVEAVETDKREREKADIETDIKDRLRGFSRTIPSFLMAYGDENVTLENFDEIIPDDVFREVTNISLDNFRFLRDGGDYTDEKTGQTEHFKGQLFDPVVFNDSVREFLSLKKKLANYFDPENKEDIFDYIPPQKTNQIFTPKWVVQKMVDELEKENPHCFDDPDKTFLDPYMKSGMYITEIVKRLYRSEKMKALYPDDKDRLNHIFEKQVYGLAPTEIIYRIAMNYILGFSDEIKIEHHNFRQVDALVYAQDGTLSQKLDELFG